MSFAEILLVAIALAMDCFTVSIVSGVISRKAAWGPALRMAFLFGLFQALMPVAGWLGIHFFQGWIESFDHWIAFGLLSFVGGKMIYDYFKGEDEAGFNPNSLRAQVALAIATSIDALAVGISMACSGYSTVSTLYLPIFIIGIVSFLLSISGYFLGIRFGNSVAKRLKPELLGGLILIAIGIKILLEHLLSI